MEVERNSADGFYVFASDETLDFGPGLAGLTLTFQLSKSGGAFGAVAPAQTDLGGGNYWIVPIAAHRDTLGQNAWEFAAAGAIIAPRYEYVVFQRAYLKDVLGNRDAIEGGWTGDLYYVDPINGSDSNEGSRELPFLTMATTLAAVTDWNQDVVYIIPGDGTAQTVLDEQVSITKNTFDIRGAGPEATMWLTTSPGDLITVTANGVRLSNMELQTDVTGSGDAVTFTGDRNLLTRTILSHSQGDAVTIVDGSGFNRILDNLLFDVGAGGSGDAVQINGNTLLTQFNQVRGNTIYSPDGDGVKLAGSNIENTVISGNEIINGLGWGISIGAQVSKTVIADTVLQFNVLGDVLDNGDQTYYEDRASVIYLNGVYLDTINGTPGQEPRVNATRALPSDSITDVKVVADKKNIKQIIGQPGSDIIFVENLLGYEFLGDGYLVHFGGFDISGTDFVGLIIIDGIATAATARPLFQEVRFNTCTIPPSVQFGCLYRGVMTFGAIGEYEIGNGFSGVTSAEFVIGTGQGTVSIENFSGGLILTAVGPGSLVNVSFLNGRKISVDGTGGQVNVSGRYESLTDLSGGSVAFNTDGASFTEIDEPLSAVVDNQETRNAMTLAATVGTAADSIDDKLDTMPVDIDTELTAQHGAGSWQEGSGGGTGTGAWTITVTVDDGVDPLSAATVRFTDKALPAVTFAGETDLNGVVVFNLDDADYTVAITRNGASFAGDELTVNGANQAVTYSMTPDTPPIPPMDPQLCTVQIRCLFQGEPTVGISVNVSNLPKPIPPNSAGLSTEQDFWTEISDSNGLATFGNATKGLLQGATVRVWRGLRGKNAEFTDFEVPLTSTALFDFVIGLDTFEAP